MTQVEKDYVDSLVKISYILALPLVTEDDIVLYNTSLILELLNDIDRVISPLIDERKDGDED